MFHLLVFLHGLQVLFSILECTRSILTHKKCAPADFNFVLLEFKNWMLKCEDYKAKNFKMWILKK